MRYYFVGIGGTAMASLAVLLQQRGHEVWGTDQNIYPPMSDLLAEYNIPVWEGYHPVHLEKPFDMAIIGNALSRGNQEIESILNRRLPFASLPEVIRTEFAQQLKSIVISGTHGKTTTTSLISWLMESAGLSPTFLIGGISQNFRSSVGNGTGRYFVIEGDEYDTAFFDKRPKFLHYLPFYLIINNIEFDHADIYDNIDQIKDGFRKLLRIIPGDGLVLANGDDVQVRETVIKSFSRLQFFGRSPENDWNFRNVRVSPRGTDFQVFHQGQFYADFHTFSTGEYQVYNSLAAIALMHELGLNIKTIRQGMHSFTGVKRRLEYWGKLNGALLYDDFAHHPTAISQILQSVKNLHPDRRRIAVFEPRTNTSIRNIFQAELADALKSADITIILPIHRAASIPENQRLSLQQLQLDLQKAQKEVILLQNYSDLQPVLRELLHDGDVAVLLTNGNLGGEYQRLRAAIQQNSSG